MGLWDKLFNKGKRPKNAVMNQSVTLKGYQPIFTTFGNNVLESDIIYCATQMKARWFSCLDPRHVRNRNGDETTVTDSSVARILRKPSDFQTISDFLQQAFFMREAYNTCFIYPDYRLSDEKQRIYTGMYILTPVAKPIIEQDQSGKLFIKFLFINPDREVVFPLDDVIIWNKNLEDNQFLGGGKYASMANTDLLKNLQGYRSMSEAIAEAAKLGCYIDGIIKVNAYGADQEKIQKVRNEFIDDLKKNKSGIAVLDNGAEYVNIQRNLKMVDAATLAEVKQNVMLHTGMTLDMLMGKFTAEERETFYQNHLYPAAKSLGEAMSRVFFTQWQTSYGDSVVIYSQKVQRVTIEQAIRVSQVAAQSGFMTLDELRAMYGLAPLPNGEGAQRPRGFNNLDGQVLGGNADAETN